MRLWYRRHAADDHEALPIGNGRLGAMVYGGADRELLTLNEDSIWSGPEQDRINPDALKHLDEIRELIFAGKIPEAERLALMSLSGIPNSQRSYLPAGECFIDVRNRGEAEDYIRYLDLDTAVAGVSYRIGGTVYKREYLASYPDGVIAADMTADGNNYIDADLRLERCHNRANAVKIIPGENGMAPVICLRSGSRGGETEFAAALTVVCEGGETGTLGEFITVRGASRVSVYIAIETVFRGADYQERCIGRIRAAAEKGFDAIKLRHTEDFRKLYGRMFLSFGGGDGDNMDALPTDERLRLLGEGKSDPALAALYYRFGRYMLASSSRGDSLPANLQGLWNGSMTPPWDSKYTININTQMNYWPALSGNIAECCVPLFELLLRVMESGKKTARKMYGCGGSVAHHNTDIYADTAPQDHYIPATFWVMGEAWLATHIFDYYRYTLDKGLLKKYFDIAEQCVLFFYDFLVPLEDGTLVTCPSVSPENTYILPDGTRGCLCAGAVMDTEILRDLFGGYIECCGILGLGEDRINRAKETLARLPSLGTGRYGQLMEWMEDYDEAEPGHRHISHLYGVYPSRQISYEKTPELMKAAKVSLERRLSYGGGHTGWSRAWITALWARFRDGEKAYENLKKLLTEGTFINLMDNHPYGSSYVFQIDGNLGACAAITEMLAQTFEDRIYLLPALPGELGSGSVSGLCLPGALTLCMEWKDGAVTSARIDAAAAQTRQITVNGKEISVVLRKGVNVII